MSIDVIKIFHIINNNIIQVIVFGHSDIGTKSSIIANDTVFSKDELNKIKRDKPEIIFSSDSIYLDDTIEVIKKKILKEMKKNISYEEIYLFAKQIDTLHNIEIYQKLTQNGKLELTRTRLLQFLSNIDEFNVDTIEDKNIYNFDDIIELNLDNKIRSLNITLGQNIITNENKYAYTINPYNSVGFDNIIESHAENIISTSNHDLLLSSGFIVNNSIYLCDATNVLKYAITQKNAENTIMKVYYPYLYNKDIFNNNELQENIISLREQNNAILNQTFTRNIENIKLFYDIYNNRTKNLDYIEQGIQTIEFVIYPDVQYNMPLEILFKLIHTNDLSVDGVTFSMSLRATQPVLPWVRVEAAVAQVLVEVGAMDAPTPPFPACREDAETYVSIRGHVVDVEDLGDFVQAQLVRFSVLHLVGRYQTRFAFGSFAHVSGSKLEARDSQPLPRNVRLPSSTRHARLVKKVSAERGFTNKSERTPSHEEAILNPRSPAGVRHDRGGVQQRQR